MMRFGIGRARRLARFLTLRKLYASIDSENTAEARAKRLLREWLTREQIDQLDEHGHFEVVGSQTGKRYRINYGNCANVQEVDKKGRLVMGLCFLPIGNLAPGDVMLAQKIAIETSEDQVLAKANRFPPRLFTPVQRRRPF
jgi:hypothetical protein